MANFGLTVGSSQIDIIGGLNYALSNIAAVNPNSLIANTSTGQITIPQTGNTYSYLYRYIHIAYANSSDGVTGFVIGNPLNKSYYGVRNSTSSAPSTNPANYVWYSVSGGFGTTKELYYSVIGGGSIVFDIAISNPDPAQWVQDIGDPIDLTISTNILNTTATIGQILVYDGFQATWQSPGSITAGTALNADQVAVNDVVTLQTYYGIVSPFKDGNYTELDADDGYIYNTYINPAQNILIAKNIGVTYNLTATNITATTITVVNETVSSLITAPSANITNITATNIVASTGQISGQFTATNISANYISSPSVQSTNITATNVISTNVNISSQFTATQANITSFMVLTPLNASPGTVVAGTIAVAHGPSWDPAVYSTTTNYVAFYNGTAWVKLG